MQDHEAQNGVFDPDADQAPEADTTDQKADVAPEPETGGSADVAGTMRWSEFNRRAAELKRREERLKGYEDFDRMLEEDEELRREIVTAVERRRGQARQPQTEDTRAIREELMETRAELAAHRIQTELDALQKEHKLTKEEANAVQLTAFKEGLIDHRTTRDAIAKRLRMVYRDMNFDKAKGSGERELVEKLREGQRAASPGGRPKGTDSEEVPDYDFGKMSYEQIAQAEMKRLGVKR